MATMPALKVVAEGWVTSFRYPHFVMQTQPTFEMPPPATIYGHICSAVGEIIDPRGLEFGYQFTSEASFDDLEHIRIWSGGNTGTFGINPFQRQLLFKPRLTLYLRAPDLEAMRRAFLSPRYVVVLGRSQDLFTYRPPEVVELEPAERAYYEHTLLPFAWAGHARRGYVVTMPRYVDVHRRRQAEVGSYVVLHDRIVYPASLEGRGGLGANFASEPAQHWVDPTEPDHPRHEGLKRGVCFHTFVDTE